MGVFHDVQSGVHLGKPKLPQIYVPFAQSPWPQATVAVRTALNPTEMTKSIAAAVHSVDPNLPLANVETMDRIAHGQFAADRSGVALYGSLAGLALILASLGIYGVMSFTIAQRTSEIALRMALGASRESVLFSVLRQGLIMAAIGLTFGFTGAYFVSRVMQSLLYGTGALDWGAFGAVAAILLIAALLACYIPAHRASAVDPMIALRQD